MTEGETILVDQYQAFKELVKLNSWEVYVGVIQEVMRRMRDSRADLPIVGLDKALEAEYLRGYVAGLAAAIGIPEASLDDLESMAQEILKDFKEIENEADDE